MLAIDCNEKRWNSLISGFGTHYALLVSKVGNLTSKGVSHVVVNRIDRLYQCRRHSAFGSDCRLPRPQELADQRLLITGGLIGSGREGCQTSVARLTSTSRVEWR